jgi:hypothetical protein
MPPIVIKRRALPEAVDIVTPLDRTLPNVAIRAEHQLGCPIRNSLTSPRPRAPDRMMLVLVSLDHQGEVLELIAIRRSRLGVHDLVGAGERHPVVVLGPNQMHGHARRY